MESILTILRLHLNLINCWANSGIPENFWQKVSAVLKVEHKAIEIVQESPKSQTCLSVRPSARETVNTKWSLLTGLVRRNATATFQSLGTCQSHASLLKGLFERRAAGHRSPDYFNRRFPRVGQQIGQWWSGRLAEKPSLAPPEQRSIANFQRGGNFE